MNLHLLIPALFWPDHSHLEVYHGLQLSALETILAKSQLIESSGQDVEAWLCQAFSVEKQQDWPVAPIMLEIDGEGIEVGNDYWLRADPVHLRIENNHILLADSQILNISLKEAILLADTINKQFATDGLTLLPLSPNRWYLQNSTLPDLQTHLLGEVAGKNINHLLPSGKDGVVWNKRINEIQMLLYDNPLNQIREANGELAINSLWIWGGGIRPGTISTPYSNVWSDHPFAHALAKASGTIFNNLPRNAAVWQQAAKSGEHLIILDDLQRFARYKDAHTWRNNLINLERDWFEPLLQALKTRQVMQLTLTTVNEFSTKSFCIRPKSLWRFWAAARSLDAYSSINI